MAQSRPPARDRKALVSSARRTDPPAAIRGAGSIEPPRLALDVSECCAALGVSWDFWTQHVAPEVRIVRRGRRKLIAVVELERWLDANAHAVLDPGHNRGCAPVERQPAAVQPTSRRKHEHG
jgi:hypothetical protein